MSNKTQWVNNVVSNKVLFTQVGIVTFYLLLETGGKILLETGGALLGEKVL